MLQLLTGFLADSAGSRPSAGFWQNHINFKEDNTMKGTNTINIKPGNPLPRI
ncbi:MAG TPA: hypothetical protein PKA28_07405 [Methylomusa anaerophila]|uniref:hypothetical protein n=1 Tax=Methylomusa anaerophila TaxID=1930071 RepID=UPI0013157041|nr:hypothetical protein [Methylomusa anaerophila]HML88260.1 hypothetical protein [Methylomusa anaerophila]